MQRRPEGDGGRFADVCRRRGIKVNGDKNKVIVLSGEERLECEIHVGGTRLEQVSEFKYLWCVLDESGTEVAACRRKMANWRKVAAPSCLCLMLEVCMRGVA